MTDRLSKGALVTEGLKANIGRIYETIQGEGLSAGAPCIRVEFGGCNLLCGGSTTIIDGDLSDGATWRCDTIKHWSAARSRTMGEVVSGINDLLRDKPLSYIVSLSGGEPLLQQNAIWKIIEEVPFRTIEIDSNGTIRPEKFLLEHEDVWFNISLKLASSGNPKELRIKPEAIRAFALHDRSIFKFTIGSRTDVTEAREVCERFSIDSSRTVFVPVGSTILEEAQNAPQVARWALEAGVIFGRRLHLCLEEGL